MASPLGRGAPLVGRDHDLSELASLAGVDADPTARSVVLSGDAGVGKTRLLEELGAMAQASGFRVLTGHCLDFGDSALPYLPFTEALGRLAVEEPELVAALTEAHPALPRLLPGRRMMSVPHVDETEPTAKGDLFAAVGSALEELGRSSPVLLILEDLHWADQSTRQLVSFLFARPATTPVSVVASYRSDDLHRTHPLRGAVAEWTRMPGVGRLGLQPLPDSDVRTLVRSIRATPLREPELADIVARAEGNPFFAEALVDAASTAGGGLPDDLSRLLLTRIDRLGEPARAVVRAASVAGRRVSHNLLSVVAGLEPGPLDTALRTAVEASILLAAAPDSYSFRHALLAEAVYGDLLPGERVRLHGAYVAALCRPNIRGTAAELARHARSAHDLPTALMASIEAGDDAMSVGGPDEASLHYKNALEIAAAETMGASVAEVDLPGLTVKAAEAVTAAGRPHRAVGLLRERLDRLPAGAPGSDRARLLAALAVAALLDESDLDAWGLAQEALELVPADPPSALRAHVMATLARTCLSRDTPEEAGRWAEAALSMGELLGLTDVVSDANTTIARLRERAGRPDESVRILQDVAGQAQARGDVTAELRSLNNLAGVHFSAGRLAEALAIYESATRRAAELGRPWSPYGLTVRVYGAVTAYMLGDWDRAAELADVTGQTPSGTGEAALAAVGMMVAAGRGDATALEVLPQVQSWWARDGVIAVLAAGAAIDLYGDAGDIERAIAIHDSAVETVTELWQSKEFQARIRLSALLLGQLAAHAATASSGDTAELVARGGDLLAAAEGAFQRHLDLRAAGPESVAWADRARAEHVRLRWLARVDEPDRSELAAVWQRSVTSFAELGHAFELARSQVRLASVLQAVGRSAAARPLVGQARATAERLGASPLRAELRALGSSAPVSRRRATGGGAEPLTAREREILRLVAAGRSNGEIGRQLFISPKTVSVHVSNILAKLGAAGRTEAAAIARRRGVLDEP